MKLHLVALPHTQVSTEFCGCAYTAKILKFCKMMGGLYDINLYAPEGPPVEGATLIPCLTDAKRLEIFGPDDANRLPDWPTDAQTVDFNLNAAIAIRDRADAKDLILLSGGRTHMPIATALPNLLCVEPGVGYEGTFTNYCAYESYAWMHHSYGRNKINDIRYFDTVIPNYFDPDDFPLINKGGGKYLAFLGRRIERKGLAAAGEIAKYSGLPLKVAGAGTLPIPVEGIDVEYLGPVDVKQRAEFLAGARALLVPTTYVEPFGGVAVEAMMCGTPAITTDLGAFTETVQNGVSGYRFRMLHEAVEAVEKVLQLPPRAIRHYAFERYSLAAVATQFQTWFTHLQTLHAKGWYTMP